MERNPVLLQRDRTGLLIVDIQEKILNVMAEPDKVVENTIKLIKGAKHLNIPIFITEQYPQGLGKTVQSIEALLQDVKFHEKITFSCCGLKDLVEELRKEKCEQIILCGIESHVCVWQTAMDLLHFGFSVYLVSDAVSSRKDSDLLTACQRMALEGVRLSTTEMVLFELLERAGTEPFKTVSKLIR